MRHSACILLIPALLIISCKSDKPSKGAIVKPDPIEKPIEYTGAEIPGISKEVLDRLINKCTFIDYIFHDLPFSLSQSEDPSIDQNIGFIDFNRPIGRLIKGCKPIGRKFFQINGNIEYDVDVYLSKHCRYYVFVDKDNKPLYANYMTDSAVLFYNNVIKQATGKSLFDK